MNLYDRIRNKLHDLSEDLKNIFLPYQAIYNGNGELLFCGHHDRDADMIADICNHAGDDYGGYRRVSSRESRDLIKKIR